MHIYNLFPLLTGPVDRWESHLMRAAEMGFDWVFVNPIQKTGRSGSLYSIADYFHINPQFCNENGGSPEAQVRKMIVSAESLGLKMMIDLVINHCAYDSKLVKQHPAWFLKDSSGRVAHPFCEHEGQKVVWEDLAQFDHEQNKDPEGFYQFCFEALGYLLDLGFKGFRCDAAYQIPSTFWGRLISDVKKTHPDVVFIAETLGCSPEQTKRTSQAGFAAVFNSSKWWNFEDSWLLQQYQLTRTIAPSISFAESHDTPRLFAETHGNQDAMKQRYLFSALFSSGVMMPIGFEFGFQKPLHVVNSKPEDWEQTGVDLTEFIREVNQIKHNYAVFQEESITDVLYCSNPQVLLLWKSAVSDGSEALIILNKDIWNRQHCQIEDLHHYFQNSQEIIDISPQWPMDFLPAPFNYELLPGMARVIVAKKTM